MKKILVFFLIILFSISCLYGCNDSSDNSSSSSSSSSESVIETNLNYIDASRSDLTEEEQAEVNELFYQNTLDTTVSPVTADPSVIYCEEDGYYYMYGTLDQVWVYGIGICCFRSKNLIDWEMIDNAFYQPNQTQLDYEKVSGLMTEEELAEYKEKSWIKNGNIWAPSVIYDKDLGKYLMFSSAQSTAKGVTPADYELFLAVSDHPAGPFIQWTGTVNGGQYNNGTSYGSREVSYEDLYIDFVKVTDNLGNYYEQLGAIDAEPFIDPVTNKKYLFFVGTRGENLDANTIFGVEMIDWFTPDMSTLSLLAVPNFAKPTDLTKTLSDEGTINEGPCVVYNEENRKYYLTYSANEFYSKTYSVKQAVADSPLGVYEKVPNQKGGRIIGCEADWIHRSGTGHHTFITVGEETFIVYPMHSNLKSTSTVWKARCIGYDRVNWVTNPDGLLVLSSDGPSYDYRLRPNIYTGYSNIAEMASITCNQMEVGADIKYLTDGAYNMLINEGKYDFNANKAPLEITLDFNSPVSVKGLMVTNSRNLERAFEKISKIEVEYTLNGQKYRAITGEVIYDWDRFYYNNKDANDLMHMISGCNSVAVFEEIQNVSRIKIYLENQIWDSVEGLSLAEILVIGK